MLSWCTHGPDQGAAIRFLVPLMTSPFWTLLTRSHHWSEFDTVRWTCRHIRVSARCMNNLTRPTLQRSRRLPALRSDRFCDRKARSCRCANRGPHLSSHATEIWTTTQSLVQFLASNLWHLLSNAVDSSSAFAKDGAVDANDIVVGEDFAENAH